MGPAPGPRPIRGMKQGLRNRSAGAGLSRWAGTEVSVLSPQEPPQVPPCAVRGRARAEPEVVAPHPAQFLPRSGRQLPTPAESDKVQVAGFPVIKEAEDLKRIAQIGRGRKIPPC